MATSSQFLMDDRTSVFFYYTVTQNSQSTVNNTSNVTVKLYVVKNNDIQTYGSGTAYLKVDGTEYSASLTTSQKFTTTPICVVNKTLTISHNSSGSKTIVCQAKFNHSMFSAAYSSSKQYSYPLTDIARCSSFTSTWTANASSGTTLGILRVDVNSADSSFSHTIKYTFGSKSATVTNISSYSNYNFPTSWLSEIPNSTSGTVTILVTTYSGSTKIGTTTGTRAITVPSWVKPSISSVSLAPVASGAATSYGYVQNKSKCAVTVTCASYSTTSGGTLASCRIACSYASMMDATKSLSGTSSTFTQNSNLLNVSGTRYFTVTVTDSRGRTATYASGNITVTAYSSPVVSSLTVTRCNISGVATNEGTYVKVTASFSGSTSISGNTVTCSIKYKQSNASSYTTLGTVTSGTGKILGGSIGADHSYLFMATATDTIGSVGTKTATLGTAKYPMDAMTDSNGKVGIAFGKTAEFTDLAEFAFPIKFSTASTALACIDFAELFYLRLSGNSTVGYGLSVVGPDNSTFYGSWNAQGFNSPQDIKTGSISLRTLGEQVGYKSCYSYFGDLGLASGCTLTEIATALPINSELVVDMTTNYYFATAPSKYGTLRVTKGNNARVLIEFFQGNSYWFIQANTISTIAGMSWSKVTTTTQAQVNA